jgi:hypothetical protein
MFTENKISRIFEIVKNIKDDEYVILNKAILIDQTGKPLKKLRDKYMANNSSIILYIKDKDKLIDYIRKICFSIDLFLLCYFNKNKKVIKINEPLTYYRIHKENISRRIRNREIAEMFLRDYQYIYEKTKCRGQIYGIVSYKILLNLMYNANYKISLREYMDAISIFDRDYIRRLSKIILYKLFRNYLKKYYLKKFIFTDLNSQNT